MLALLAALVPDEPGAFYFPDDLSRNSLLTLRSPVQVYPSFWYVLACATPQNGPDLNLSQHCALLEPTSRPRDHYINTPSRLRIFVSISTCPQTLSPQTRSHNFLLTSRV